MMPVIDACYAWQIIRDAPDRPADGLWQPAAGLAIEANGTWSSDRDIDPAAAELFDTLLPVAANASRFVIAQLGQSLDGRIATASGHSHYVNGRAGRIHLHRLRALVDAVVVGAGTVAADNPKLTVRHVAGDHPARVVLDPNARASPDRTVFTDSGPTTWHAVREAGRAAPGAVPLGLPDVSDAALPETLLARLAERGMTRVLVEGGGVTVSRFVEAGCVDRLHVMIAPMLIGSGRPALALDEIESLDQAHRPSCRSFDVGEDRLYDLDLRGAA